MTKLMGPRILGAMAIVLIAGCTGTTGGPMPRPTASANGVQGVLLTSRSLNSSLPHMEASIIGELGISASGCVTIGDFVIVAPHGSTIVGDRVHLESITDAVLGDKIQAPGGLLDVLTIPAASRPHGYEQCAARELAFISPP